MLVALLTLFSLAGMSIVQAQSNDEAEAEGEIIELSPFEVSVDALRGYVTTSSLSGSRIVVPITELAGTTITINENLIADSVAQDLRDTLNMVAGVTHGNVGTGNQLNQIFSLRGYTVSSALRDGLPSLMMTSAGGWDYSIVERMELSKGPAGVLFGSHSPGGVLSITSKLPKAAPATTIELRAGSFNYYRASIDHSGFTADGKLGYRVSTALWDWDGPAELPNEPGSTFVFNPSLSYRWDNGLKVWAWYTHMEDNAANRRPNMTYAFGMRTAEHAPFPAVHEGIANNGQTYSNLWSNLSAVEIDSLEFGISKIFSGDNFDGAVRFIARLEERDSNRSRIRGIGGRNYLAANDVLIGTESRDLTLAQVDTELVRITRNASRFDDRGNTEEQDFFTVDLTLNFDTGPVGHQVLTYAQYQKTDNTDRERRTDIRHAELPQDVQDANGWDNGRITMWPNPAYGPITPAFMAEFGGASIDRGSNDFTQDVFSWGIMERASLFNRRLIGVVGLRYDSLDQFNRFTREDRATPTDSTFGDDDWSSKYGVVGKVYEGDSGVVSLFYNNAETFTIETRIDTRLGTIGKPLPNRVTSTDEFGIKLDMWGNRLGLTLSFFDNTESNVLITRFDDLAGTITGVPAPFGNILGQAYLTPAGDRLSEGWDIDLAVSPIDGLDIILAYGNVDVKITEGEVQGVPDDTFSAFVRYKFLNGALSGFSTAWQYNSWGQSGMNSNFARPNFTQAFVKGDSVHHLIVGYEWKGWDFRVRITNLFDDVIVRPNIFWTAMAMEPDRRFIFSVTKTFGHGK